MKKYSIKEHKKALLKHCGFKKVWCEDKSGYWFEKKINIDGFKGKLICDERYCYMDIQVYADFIMESNRKIYETIWKGKWNKFKELIKKYK